MNIMYTRRWSEVDRAYEKTKNGFLRKRYWNMTRRIRGTMGHYKGCVGLPICTVGEFLSWAEGSKEFHEMFDAWVASGYQRKLTPTVDRIVLSKGYAIGNIQWLTMLDNTIKGTQEHEHRGNNSMRGIYRKFGKRQITYMVCIASNYLGTFKTLDEAIKARNEAATARYGKWANLVKIV